MPDGPWFFRYWRRGWGILLLTVLVGLCARSGKYVLEGAAAYGHRLMGEGRPIGEPVMALIGVLLVVLALPVCAYLVFVLFFGEEGWTWGKKVRTPSREETAMALFEEGNRLEAYGNRRGALGAYNEVVQDYPETPAAKDARKSIETLRDRPDGNGAGPSVPAPARKHDSSSTRGKRYPG